MKKYFTLLLAISGFAISPVLAQKDFRAGYVVTLQQDTLKGLVNAKGDLKNAQICTFKANVNANEQDFKPEEIKGFGLNGGRVYETKKAKIVSRKINLANQFPEEPVAGHTNLNFMEVVARGKVNLYYLEDATAAPHFYIQKDTAALQELVYLEAFITNRTTGNRELYRSKLYVGTLLMAFSDCPDPTLKPKVEKIPLHINPLREVVVMYNQCRQAPNNIASERPHPKTTWGIVAGISSASLNIKTSYSYLNEGNYKGNTGLTGGITLDLPLPLLNEKLSLHNTLLFSHKKFTANYNMQEQSYLYYNYDIQFDFKYIGLNPQLRYHVPAKTIKPYFGAGFSGNALINEKQVFTKTAYRTGYEPEKFGTPKPFDEFRKIEIGINITAGAKFPFTPNLKVLLETRFERGNGFSPYNTIATRTYTFSFMTGLEF